MSDFDGTGRLFQEWAQRGLKERVEREDAQAFLKAHGYDPDQGERINGLVALAIQHGRELERALNTPPAGLDEHGCEEAWTRRRLEKLEMDDGGAAAVAEAGVSPAGRRR